MRMDLSEILSIASIFMFFAALGRAATFSILNNCSYTVWAAAVPGGGRQLDPGRSWSLNVPARTTNGRIWARTNCSFDAATGNGTCLTGDCGGRLQCQSYGTPPNTLAEFAVEYNNLDFFDISLVDGFNVPMAFNPATSEGCTSRGIQCADDIVRYCPAELQAPGGCNNPCTVFKTDQYCCSSGSCGPTEYSRYFKNRCPDAYSYPKDDETSTFTCPGGTNYNVVFCPVGTYSTNQATSWAAHPCVNLQSTLICPWILSTNQGAVDY